MVHSNFFAKVRKVADERGPTASVPDYFMLLVSFCLPGDYAHCLSPAFTKNTKRDFFPYGLFLQLFVKVVDGWQQECLQKK